MDEFIRGAEEPPTVEEDESEKTYPWEEPQVREDVKKGYPLRLPEPLYLKLKYISEETGRSMNKLCNDAVEELVERKLEELA